jgi:hypothetical protein
VLPSLRGKVCLITGASGAMGRVTATELHADHGQRRSTGRFPVTPSRCSRPRISSPPDWAAISSPIPEDVGPHVAHPDRDHAAVVVHPQLGAHCGVLPALSRKQ